MEAEKLALTLDADGNYPTREDLAHLVFDLLNNPSVESIAWSEWIEWSDCEEEPSAWLSACEDMLELIEPAHDHVVTRVDLEAAYKWLGRDLEADTERHEKDCEIRACRERAEFYKSQISSCGDNPRFAVAKRNYQKLLSDEIKALKILEA